MATVISRDQLTTDERKEIEERYAPYHRFQWFWDGYYTYQGETGRYRCPHGWSHSVPSRAWHYGHDAAMRLRAGRKMPARDEYEREDRDSEKQVDGLRSAREWKRANGTLPKPSVSSARRDTVANDNSAGAS
jgi:hypothetical protein